MPIRRPASRVIGFRSGRHRYSPARHPSDEAASKIPIVARARVGGARLPPLPRRASADDRRVQVSESLMVPLPGRRGQMLKWMVSGRRSAISHSRTTLSPFEHLDRPVRTGRKRGFVPPHQAGSGDGRNRLESVAMQGRRYPGMGARSRSCSTYTTVVSASRCRRWSSATPTSSAASARR